MTFEELTQLQSVLEQAKSIVHGSIAQKPTSQDYDLEMSILRLQMKVEKRIAQLKRTKKP